MYVVRLCRLCFVYVCRSIYQSLNCGTSFKARVARVTSLAFVSVFCSGKRSYPTDIAGLRRISGHCEASDRLLVAAVLNSIPVQPVEGPLLVAPMPLPRVLYEQLAAAAPLADGFISTLPYCDSDFLPKEHAAVVFAAAATDYVASYGIFQVIQGVFGANVPRSFVIIRNMGYLKILWFAIMCGAAGLRDLCKRIGDPLGLAPVFHDSFAGMELAFSAYVAVFYVLMALRVHHVPWW
ncbi:hypothetical protein MTO96_021159 [Rhipicephalus appendiculatus]